MWRAAKALLLCPVLFAACAEEGPPPNIVWIVIEDLSPHFSAYGEGAIRTPQVDGLAAAGTLFRRAFVTSPVCSPSKSALITGMYQTSIGAEHHRSGRGELTIRLPEPVRPLPELFRQAGYHTSLVTLRDFMKSEAELSADPRVEIARPDYNFEWDPALYDRTHWSHREEGRPFFVQVRLRGGKLRGHGTGGEWPNRVHEILGSLTPRSAVVLPPHLPEHPVIVDDWRQYLDAVRFTDHEVGMVLDRLLAAGELERSVVILISDHGMSHVRAKQFCYEGGMHIPLVIAGPGVAAGVVRDDLVEHIDVAATSLALARIDVPSWMQARDLLSRWYRSRDFVFCARDRCDETVDRIRAVRGERYKYIRNFLPRRPYLQPNAYKDGKPIVKTLRKLHAAGRLDSAQSRFLAEERPPEELYDLEADPHETRNLAGDPAHAGTLGRMRRAQEEWSRRSGNAEAESPEMYESDMRALLGDRRRAEQRLRNIALMKRWAAEGR